MRRLVLVIAVLAASPLRAEQSVSPGDAVAGAALYDQACARCHRDPRDLKARLDPDPDVAAAALVAKLARHHAEDAAMQADIIAYLLASE